MTSNNLFRMQLLRARKARGYNQEELAKETGLKPAAISHFETGERKPSLDNLRKLADALSVTSDYLLGRTKDMEGFADASAAFRHGYEKLSQSQRELALDMIEVLRKKNS